MDLLLHVYAWRLATYHRIRLPFLPYVLHHRKESTCTVRAYIFAFPNGNINYLDIFNVQNVAYRSKREPVSYTHIDAQIAHTHTHSHTLKAEIAKVTAVGRTEPISIFCFI